MQPTDSLHQLFVSFVSIALLFCLMWFGILFLVGKAFGKRASADVQKLGWKFITETFRLLGQAVRALWRLVNN